MFSVYVEGMLSRGICPLESVVGVSQKLKCSFKQTFVSHSFIHSFKWAFSLFKTNKLASFYIKKKNSFPWKKNGSYWFDSFISLFFSEAQKKDLTWRRTDKLHIAKWRHLFPQGKGGTNERRFRFQARKTRAVQNLFLPKTFLHPSQPPLKKKGRRFLPLNFSQPFFYALPCRKWIWPRDAPIYR